MSLNNSSVKANSACDILQRLLEGLSNQDWNTLVNLYAEDVVIQWPLTLPTPTIVHGREALHKALQAGWQLLELRASNIRVHQTLDPEIVIAEYDYDGKVRATGKTFHSSNVLVLTVRNGRIMTARGYHNHALVAEKLGTSLER